MSFCVYYITWRGFLMPGHTRTTYDVRSRTCIVRRTCIRRATGSGEYCWKCTTANYCNRSFGWIVLSRGIRPLVKTWYLHTWSMWGEVATPMTSLASDSSGNHGNGFVYVHVYVVQLNNDITLVYTNVIRSCRKSTAGHVFGGHYTS